MKKIYFIFILLWMGGMFSFLAGENFYFPECQVLVPTPSGWFAYNGSTYNKGGIVLVSSEKITGQPLPSQTGLSFFYGKNEVMGVRVYNTNQLASKIFPIISEKFPGTMQKDLYELEGKLGKFKFLEINPGDSYQPVMAIGVLKSDKGAFVVILYSPHQKWDSSKPVLLKIVENTCMYMTRRPGDKTVYSVNDNVLSGICKQRDHDQKGILLERFKKLKKGMTEEKYKDIMKYEWKMVEELKKGFNFTPGLVRTIPVSINGEDYVDVYGVYNRCISEELFYVWITNKKIKRLKLIKRSFPKDFDIDAWENFLVGLAKNKTDMAILFTKLLSWTTDPKRAMLAVKRLENVKIGMDEQEYLSAAQGFMIHFSVTTTYRIIPGVFKLNTLKDPAKGLKREYLYASCEDKKMVPLKKVVVLDGKVVSITTVEKEELMKPTLSCNPTVVKPGGIILVDFTAPSDYPQNAWIGIVPAHISHGLETVNDFHDLSYKYLKNRSRGTLFFTAPMKPGDYDFRMNDSDDGGKEVCAISFTVKAPLAKKAPAESVSSIKNVAKRVSNKEIQLAGIQHPKLIKKVEPAYPSKALKAHIQGNVIIEATSDIYGRVVSARVLAGPEMLRPAAEKAIRQWQYEPYLLDGVPRPVKFTVVVKFKLKIENHQSIVKIKEVSNERRKKVQE